MNTPATESHGFARRFEMVPLQSAPAATVGNTICAAPNRRRSLNRRTIASQAAAYLVTGVEVPPQRRVHRGPPWIRHVTDAHRLSVAVRAVRVGGVHVAQRGRDGGRGDRFAVDDGRDRGPQTRMSRT